MKSYLLSLNKIFCILVLSCLLWSSISQSCIDRNGQPISWWVQLIYPKTVPSQYAYFDSKFTTNQFQSQAELADSPSSAFYKTLQSINILNLQYIAWNDQLPNGTTSSVKAHSKGILSFDDTLTTGFYFGHSIPMFPNTLGIIIKPQISSGQKTYGQHAFCITLNAVMIQQMRNRILPMRPYIYATNIQPLFIKKLEQINPPDYVNLFTNISFTNLATNFYFIFKNGALNGSLFQDGLNNLFKSSLLVQSWGRPIQQPWCSPTLPVGNIEQIKINDISFWKRTQDHSKWAFVLQSQYSCFGDANRMQSQWKRGGAFYCIESPNLKQALRSIINQSNICLLNYSAYLITIAWILFLFLI